MIFLIRNQPDLSSMVSIMEEHTGGIKSRHLGYSYMTWQGQPFFLATYWTPSIPWKSES
jgi:hypothetical protein